MNKYCILLSLIALSACSSSQGERHEYPSHSYDEIAHLLIDWQDAITVSSNEHMLYYYSETCVHCEELKDHIIDFALTSTMEIYFIKTNAHIEHNYEYYDINQTIGSGNVGDIYVDVTPQLAVIKDSVIEYNVINNIYIEELLSHYE